MTRHSVGRRPRLITRWTGPRWQDLVRRTLGVTCDGCDARLRVGVPGPLCVTCDVATEPIGVWRLGPDAMPVLRAWRYGGPIAAAIVGAKFRQGTFDPANWLGGLDSGLAERLTPGDVLVPVAPHAGRLVRRGRHLPDELARAIRCGIPRASRPRVCYRVLVRTDDAAPRSADATASPRFEAIAPCPPVWLVDDVITSGHTLGEARRALIERGIPVRGALCLADAGSG